MLFASSTSSRPSRARLAALAALATNIYWTWDRQTQALFAQLEPALWESSGHDPLRLIAGITAARWAELSADPEIAALTDAAAERLAAGHHRATLVPGPARQPARTRRLLLARVRAHRDAAAVLAAVSAYSPATT